MAESIYTIQRHLNDIQTAEGMVISACQDLINSGRNGQGAVTESISLINEAMLLRAEAAAAAAAENVVAAARLLRMADELDDRATERLNWAGQHAGNTVESSGLVKKEVGKAATSSASLVETSTDSKAGDIRGMVAAQSEPADQMQQKAAEISGIVPDSRDVGALGTAADHFGSLQQDAESMAGIGQHIINMAGVYQDEMP